jgi:battenin
LQAFLFKTLTFPLKNPKQFLSVLHVLVCIAQAMSYLIVAFTSSIEMSLVGVTFAALSSGLGDICYLALASHYDK